VRSIDRIYWTILWWRLNEVFILNVGFQLIIITVLIQDVIA